MRRLILLFISSCATLFVSAQKEISSDSIRAKKPETFMRQPIMDLSSFSGDMAISEDVKALDFLIFHQPLLPDYSKNMDFRKYLDQSKGISSSSYFTGSFSNLVFPFGYVFNQSSYQLNDRFLIGGSTFGAQSVFDRPKLNSTIQDMSIKGASMFMQYKVNDHFKVETRISISKSAGSPFEP